MAGALVQKTSGTQFAGTNKSLAYASNVTAGNLLVAGFSWQGGLQTIDSFTDTQGNIWGPATALANQANADFAILYFAVAGISAANTVTGVITGAENIALHIFEFSGYAGTEDGSGNTTTFVNSVDPTISLTTGNNNSLVVCFGNSAGGPFTPHAGFTAGENTSAANYESSSYNLDAGTAGSITGGLVSGNFATGALVIAAFNIASVTTAVKGVGRSVL